ncbi:MAG: amidase, partial [Alphaproteobacteria bacterium]|nr:amidase [Alphaproteobacteria bacterium]
MCHADQLSRALLDGRAADGLACTYEEYRAAERRIIAYRRAVDATMEGFDLLLTPSAPGEAPPGIAKTGDAVFNGAWTTLHLPAVTLPVGPGPTGLPLGIQIIGQRHRDPDFLAAAKAVAEYLSSVS